MVRGSPNPLHMALPTRFRKARNVAGLTRMALAQAAGCGQSVAVEIEDRQRLPSVATLARLASALQVSPSWLAYGLGDMKPTDPHVERMDMATRLQAARSAAAMSRAELGRHTSLSPRAIAKIEGGGQSGVDIIELLAKALGVSPGWLAFGLGPQVVTSPRRGRPPAQSPADAH